VCHTIKKPYKISILVISVAVLTLVITFVFLNNPSFAYNKKVLSSPLSPASGFSVSDIQRDTSAKYYKTQFKIDKSQFKKAPDFDRVTGYVNTSPIKLSDLKGKVVLVHFWTYTCINCIHTIPHLNDWYEKYANKGFVIAGIQTPEFEFEKNIDSVKNAVKDFKIKYPIIQDNDYGTWNAYGNRYWPRDYLLDNEGYIRYDHIGEGGYDETENIIQSLLAEPGTMTNLNSTGIGAN
jgi:thiol-disulfide isomerase/thioredoxin